MNQLFILRWKEKNRALQQKFLHVRQEMVNRGILNSSNTIKKAHELLVTEFESNRKLISQTILDHIKSLNRIASNSDFQDYAQKQLTERKEYLEHALESEFSNILKVLQSSAMISPFRNLDNQHELAQRELTIELNNVIDTFNRSFGNNLTDQLKNSFLNKPILAIVILSVTGAGFIIGMLRLIGVLSFG